MILIKKFKIIYFISGLLFFILSCTSDFVFEKKTEILNGIWNKNNVISFNATINDTISLHNIYLFINNSDSYNFCNLYLFISVTSPSRGYLKDTSEFVLMDKRGKWYGKKSENGFLNKILYKKNVIFPRAGNYSFKIEQAMRTDNVNINSVGLAIEKSKN